MCSENYICAFRESCLAPTHPMPSFSPVKYYSLAHSYTTSVSDGPLEHGFWSRLTVGLYVLTPQGQMQSTWTTDQSLDQEKVRAMAAKILQHGNHHRSHQASGQPQSRPWRGRNMQLSLQAFLFNSSGTPEATSASGKRAPLPSDFQHFSSCMQPLNTILQSTMKRWQEGCCFNEKKMAATEMCWLSKNRTLLLRVDRLFRFGGRRSVCNYHDHAEWINGTSFCSWLQKRFGNWIQRCGKYLMGVCDNCLRNGWRKVPVSFGEGGQGMRFEISHPPPGGERAWKGGKYQLPISKCHHTY